MILSQTAVYALRAVLHLAETDVEPVRVDDIADALGVPRNYLSKILHVLARAKLLESTRGPKGGFQLAVPSGKLSLVDIIRPFDDVATESACLLGRERCSDDNPCAAHERWKTVSEAVLEFLKRTTIEDLARSGGPIPGAALPKLGAPSHLR